MEEDWFERAIRKFLTGDKSETKYVVNKSQEITIVPQGVFRVTRHFELPNPKKEGLGMIKQFQHYTLKNPVFFKMVPNPAKNYYKDTKVLAKIKHMAKQRQEALSIEKTALDAEIDKFLAQKQVEGNLRRF